MRTGPAENGVDVGHGLTVTQQRAGAPEHFPTAYMPTMAAPMSRRPSDGFPLLALVPVVVLLVAVLAVCVAVARESRRRLAE